MLDIPEGAKLPRLKGCLHDPASPRRKEAWDRFNVLKIELSCGIHALAKLFRSEYFKVI